MEGFREKDLPEGKVLIKGQFADIVGIICMDQTMVDVTHIRDVKIGDGVVLIGGQEEKYLSAAEVANKYGQKPPTLTSLITRRVPRFYIKHNKIFKRKSHLLERFS